MRLASWLSGLRQPWLPRRMRRQRRLTNRRRLAGRSCFVSEALEDRTLLSSSWGTDVSAADSYVTDSPDLTEGSDNGELAPGANSGRQSKILLVLQPGSEAADLQITIAGAIVQPVASRVPELVEVLLPAGVDVEDALAAFQRDELVRVAEPDFQIQVTASEEPNDAFFGALWGLHNTGQAGGTDDADIDALEAWSVTTGSNATVVAVIDTGVDYSHQDLATNIWVNQAEIPGNEIDDDFNGYVDDVHGYDFVNDDGDPMDDNGHGTHVAGTIGAIDNNGLGVVGVSPNVQIMALKFLNADGSGYLSDAIKAIDYAVANGAVISNNSWSGGGYSQTLYEAIANAGSVGHIFVAAAGNATSNNDSSPAYPASYELDNIISVAATDRNDALASFSNYGATTVDLAAPGVSILSTTPGDSYSTYSGTSMATPHVAGVVALVRSQHPDWSYTQVVDQVLSSVDPIDSLEGLTVTGGRLNASAAVDPVLLSRGTLTLNASSYEIGEPIVVTLRDMDLSGTGSTSLTVNTGSGDSTSATLTETEVGVFVGSIATATTGGSGDAGLMVNSGDSVTVTYNDADDGTGTPAVVTATANVYAFVEVFRADFSDLAGNPNFDGFVIDNTGGDAAGLWHLSTGRGSQPGHSGQNSLYFGTGETSYGGGNYDVGHTAGRVTSPSIDLSDADVAELSFSYFLETENFSPYDAAQVLVSLNGGDFVLLAGNGGSGLVDPTNGWTTAVLDLTPFVGGTIQVQLDFNTRDNAIHCQGRSDFSKQ